MTKITIINAVPINGGDEALLEATLLGIKDTFTNPSILVLCNNPVLYKKYFPDLELDWDWEYVFLKNPKSENNLIFKTKRRIRHLLKKYFNLSYSSSVSRLLASKSERRVYKKLSKSDKVIVSAGGYIHDFYGYTKRIKTLDFIHNHFKIPYYIFSQSVGPFWETENFTDLKRIFRNAKHIILREKYSLNHLKNIGYEGHNITVTNDVAFYLTKNLAKQSTKNKTLKNIAINFRAWKYDTASKDNLQKAIMLCNKLIDDGYRLTFLSTCQGVAGYVDDSKFAKKIVEKLPNEKQSQCTILENKFSLNELIERLSTLDGYIGMRLHGAILSLLAGIPALNIAYEDKTIGIFSTMGIDDFCFWYKDDYRVWESKVSYFIANYETYLAQVNNLVLQASKDVEKNFKLLK